jgi:RNA polymerase sigma-70 factor, ECF subfamily
LTRFANEPLALPRWLANNQNMADGDDLIRAQSGDREAFGRLVRTHYRRIYSCVAHILGNHSDADDAAQEAFLRAYVGLGGFDGRSEFSTWLYRIAINTALNFRRKGRATAATAAAGAHQVNHLGGRPEALANQPHNPAEQLQIDADLKRVLSKVCELSPSLRVTLVLTTVEQLSHKQVAEILNVPEGTVAWRVNEARRMLRVALSDAGSEKSAVASNLSQSEPKV